MSNRDTKVVISIVMYTGACPIRLLDKTFENIIASYTNDSYNKM